MSKKVERHLPQHSFSGEYMQRNALCAANRVESYILTRVLYVSYCRSSHVCAYARVARSTAVVWWCSRIFLSSIGLMLPALLKAFTIQRCLSLRNGSPLLCCSYTPTATCTTIMFSEPFAETWQSAWAYSVGHANAKCSAVTRAHRYALRSKLTKL